MAIARIDEIVGAANNTTTNYDISVGAPAQTVRGVCVIIVQHGSAADQVSSVAYGTAADAVVLTERRFAPLSGGTSEPGAVYIYWGSGVTFPTGAQTVRVVKTVATADHRAAVCRVTTAVNTQMSVDFDTSALNTAGSTNPSWTHNTVAAQTECYFGWVSDLNAITGISIGANWTSLATIVDEGNQQIIFGRRTMGAAGNALPAVTAPSDAWAGASISFKEASLPAILAGLNVAQAQSTAGPTLAVAHNLGGLNAAQAQAAENVTLAVVATDRRPRILGQSFIPIEQSTL